MATMGLGNAFLRDLIELKRGGALDNVRNVVEIGDQQLADSLITAPELAEAYRLFGCAKPPAFDTVGVENFTDRAPSARAFWQALGLDHASIDIDGGTVPLDLNCDQVPAKLRGGFDLLINAGTTEHVANQGNAFGIIHDLVRPGGVMYHELPAVGYIDHGLVSYQPKFFTRLAFQNDYEILRLTMTAYPPSEVPAYLSELNQKYGGAMPSTIIEVAIRVAFRKRSNLEFATPLDVAPAFMSRPWRTRLGQLRFVAARLKRAICD